MDVAEAMRSADRAGDAARRVLSFYEQKGATALAAKARALLAKLQT